VKDEIHPSDGALRKRQIRQVALEELDALDVIQIATLAGDETVGDANGVTAADEFFRQM
jgi:hypothetical protein